MGELPGILSLLRAPGMTDADILAVINPPAAERNRTALVEAPRLPPHDVLRTRAAIGTILTGPQHVLRVNHFTMDVTMIAPAIAHYHVSIKKYDNSGQLVLKDSAVDGDVLTNTSLLLKLFQRHPDWTGMGFSYDGRASLFTSQDRFLQVTEDVGLPSGLANNGLGEESTRVRFRIVLTQVDVIYAPPGAAWNALAERNLRALDISLLTFARNLCMQDVPAWNIIGQKVFAAGGKEYPLTGPYIARRGYYAALKCCLAGLVLVVDMSVQAFIHHGPIMDVMREAAQCRERRDFEEMCRQGFHPRVLDMMLKAVKGCKVRLIHLGHTKKAIGLGPPADSPESSFEHDGVQYTVAKYYEMMAKDVSRPQYRNALVKGKGKLSYPKMPTINVGSKTHPVLIPAELVHVLAGQSRASAVDAEMTSQIIRVAAVRPEERMQFICDGDANSPSVVSVLTKDDNTKLFGLDGIGAEPMITPAVLLPPARLLYGGNKTMDTGLAGSWNIDRPQQRFVRLPPAPARDGSFKYGLLLAGDAPPREPDWRELTHSYMATIEKDAMGSGLKLQRSGDFAISNTSKGSLHEQLTKMKDQGARIVLVVLVSPCYATVKLVADGMGLVTQCAKWDKVKKPPRGYHLNVVLKINTKLGGTCHTLASRLPGAAPSPSIFADPPASLSWLFDKPCMLVGIDVSHPEPGSTKPSMAAVVGSMDGRASQYAAYLTTLMSKQEMVSTLQDAMLQLLTVFKQRNNKLPATIIVYRDGVSDGQFSQVIDLELPCIHGALELMGVPIGSIKVAIVVCQKRHHTRIVYQDNAAGGEYINPCPGLVLDARGGNKSVTSATINEFYLNSHAAIQGTAKPCKYALIYDEIGFRLSELELLTYWTTYLYARCNKSVSYATPAYYAHWAAQRCKELFVAGCTDTELRDISNNWSRAGIPSTMFFI